MAYLREGTVVPEITLVGEAVADESNLSLLDILLDGVKELFLGDLIVSLVCEFSSQGVLCMRHEPRACRWSIGESRQSCSEWSSAHFTHPGQHPQNAIDDGSITYLA
jgi:hypothetical protein